jgi:DNA adenine methylase
VTIECLPYADVIARYDRPHTFFYIDPPYWGFKAYRFNFEPKDFERAGRRVEAADMGNS